MVREMKITFAQKNDQEKLIEIFQQNQLVLARKIEEYVVLRNGSRILAGGKIIEVEPGLYHLAVFGADKRCADRGRQLMSALLKEPWQYCVDALNIKGERYLVSAISKGEDAYIYREAGFKQCSFAMIVSPYNVQCDLCPDNAACEPVPFLYLGGE